MQGCYVRKNAVVHSLSSSQATSQVILTNLLDQEKDKVIEIGRQRDTSSCFSQRGEVLT